MKYTIQKNGYIVIALGVFFSGLGVFIADAASQNEIVIKGVLGIAVILFISLFGKSINTNKTLDSVFIFPENIRYFALAFFGGLVSYWSAGYVYAMILCFIYR